MIILMMARLIKYLDLDEFKKLLKAEKDRRYKLAYVLAFGSGLRISEILGPAKNSNKEIKPLTASQVDLGKRQIKIFGKGGKERIATTSPWLKESHLSMLPLNINRRTCQYHFTQHCRRVLKKELNFHMLRHGWANWMINILNVPLPVVQTLGGWSRLDTVGIYAKANPVRAVARVWEEF